MHYIFTSIYYGNNGNIFAFSSEMWLGVLIFLFCVCFVFYILGQIHLNLRRKEALRVRNCLLIMEGQLRREEEQVGKGKRFQIMKIKKIPKGSIKETISIKIKILPKEV